MYFFFALLALLQVIVAVPVPRLVTRYHTADTITSTQTYVTGTTTIWLPPVEIFISNGVTYTFTDYKGQWATTQATLTSVFNDAVTPAGQATPTVEAPSETTAETNTVTNEAETTAAAAETTPAPTTTQAAATQNGETTQATTTQNAETIETSAKTTANAETQTAPTTSATTTTPATAAATTSSTSTANAETEAAETTKASETTSVETSEQETQANETTQPDQTTQTTETANAETTAQPTDVATTAETTAETSSTDTTADGTTQQETTQQETTQQETTDATTQASPETTLTKTTATSTTATATSTATSVASGYISAPSVIVYSPYANDGSCKDYDTIKSDLQLIQSKGISKLRLYGADCAVTTAVLPLCMELGITVNQGFWISSAGVDSIDGYVSLVVEWAETNGWSVFDFFTVGNEAVNDGSCTVSELIDKIASVKQILNNAGYSGEVTTSEPPVTFINHPSLCTDSVIDFVGVNPHSYFNANLYAYQAGEYITAQQKQVASICSKSAFITETGYPHKGDSYGNNVPSDENQYLALASIMKYTGGDVTILTTYDDMWKNPGPHGIEQYFGMINLIQS
ncbi:Exo-beta-1,3-glucanase, GH17 family [Metschnikowia aff. pulcherrima]|uniref:Exo-beta-1,3-glucanase, GH17 family n=1 Tax=Metschnikowia aff. pulcherrima TaxID=2163413 RepID=A0A4V1AEK5_9ASCO|nr:Exo-beta-1,3-glucanase, GH17 family [Metschnikowia aff. pulcherrima]